jgi:hypothetical protein
MHRSVGGPQDKREVMRAFVNADAKLTPVA